MTDTPKPVITSRADALARAERAWHARLLGASWADAARVAGYSSRSNAQRAVKRVFGRLPAIEIEEMKHLWRERLEVIWRQAMLDLKEQRPGAVTAAVRVEQAAAQLDGLDAPSRLRVGVDPTQEQIDEWLDRMVGPRHSDEEADIFEDAEVVEAEVIE